MEVVRPTARRYSQPEDDFAFDSPRLAALPASDALAAQLQECFQRAPEYFTRTEGTLPGPDLAEGLLADVEADPCRRLYAFVPRTAARKERPVVGVLDLHLDYPEPGTVQIGLLLFREAFQGLGYGKETMAAVEMALACAGYQALRLSVVDENLDAKLFWQRLGFAEVGQLDSGVTLYEKPLAAPPARAHPNVGAAKSGA